VIGDKHGHVTALGERECSIQRKHQKIIEETPSPAVDERLRRKLVKAAPTRPNTSSTTVSGPSSSS